MNEKYYCAQITSPSNFCKNVDFRLSDVENESGKAALFERILNALNKVRELENN